MYTVIIIYKVYCCGQVPARWWSRRGFQRGSRWSTSLGQVASSPLRIVNSSSPSRVTPPTGCHGDRPAWPCWGWRSWTAAATRPTTGESTAASPPLFSHRFNPPPPKKNKSWLKVLGWFLFLLNMKKNLDSFVDDYCFLCESSCSGLIWGSHFLAWIDYGLTSLF